MVSRKCSSAEREFLAIACGQTLELKKNGSIAKRFTDVAHVFAEAQHYAELIGLDAEETG